MKPYQVVTEGRADVLLLQAILAISPDDPQIEFVAAGGWSRVDSYARTILIQDEANVAVVVGANTRDPNVAESRRQFLHRSLREVVLHKRFCVVVIESAIESLLFQQRSILEQLIGRPVSDTDWTRAYYEPRKVLGGLLHTNDYEHALRTKLPQIDLSLLANANDLRDLKNFLRHAKLPASAVR